MNCAKSFKELIPCLWVVFSLFFLSNCNKSGKNKQAPPGSKLSKVGIVLPVGKPDEWDGGMVESPAVWYDSLHHEYGMVFTGYRLAYPDKKGYAAVSDPHIGLAWSHDLDHWTKDPNNPMFAPSGKPGSTDATGTSGPFMWYEKGMYYLFYFGLTKSGYEKGRKTLNVAMSNDLKNWTRYKGNPVIAPYDHGWRSDAIWHPNIVKVSGTYYLFFNASGVVDGKHEERTGYATSKDLLHWTVDDTHSPVLSGSGIKGHWDSSGRAGDPCVYRIGNIWYMAYYSWNDVHSSDGLAMTSLSKFPLGWKPYKGNPVLTVGKPGSFDGLHAGKPFIFITKDRYFHFYTAVDTAQKREIALAVWPPLKN